MGEAATSPESVGDCGYEYSSEQRDFAETGDMGFVVKEVATNSSATVAPSIMLSEADSQDDLESLDASEDSWLDSVAGSGSSEQSAAKKCKGRTIFSAEQLQVLQQRFQLQRYVSASERQDLGNALGLSSQQVKTWFQNRRMKVKRILKEPFNGPHIGFLQTDLSLNNAVVYGKPSDYLQQPFDNYSLPCLPRQLVSTPSKQWPSPGSMYPSLGNFQSTLIKSELQYTKQSVNFSIKKEAIELSSRPELEPRKSPVTSYSHTVPVQHIEFSSLQRALCCPGHLHQGPSRLEHLHQGPSRLEHLHQGPSRLEHLHQGPSRLEHLHQGPSRPGHLQGGLSFAYEMHKPAEDEILYEKVIIS
uniref:uncharacterized protein n=1 Tax=Pristiophorus japonicus TaxID=55135 RepID=UPI00398F3AB8